MRISALDVNKIQAALKHRPNKLNLSLAEDDAFVKEEKESQYGEDIKVVNHLTRQQVNLSPKDEDTIIALRQSGMSMAAIAKEYGCHYQTVKKILRVRETRDKN